MQSDFQDASGNVGTPVFGYVGTYGFDGLPRFLHQRWGGPPNRWNPDARSTDGHNELTYVVETGAQRWKNTEKEPQIPAAVLKFLRDYFLAYGGQCDPTFRDPQGRSEEDVLREYGGDEAVAFYKQKTLVEPAGMALAHEG